MAELLEAAHEGAREAGGGEPVEVIGAEIAVLDAIAQEMVGRHEDGVPDRERSLLLAAPAGPPRGLCAQVAAADAARPPPTLHQQRLEPALPRARFAGLA